MAGTIEGWRRVPAQPTQAMLAAGKAAGRKDRRGSAIVRAMIEVAPQPREGAEGWVLVPPETMQEAMNEMLAAGAKAWLIDPERSIGTLYRATVEAASRLAIAPHGEPEPVPAVRKSFTP